MVYLTRSFFRCLVHYFTLLWVLTPLPPLHHGPEGSHLDLR